MGVLVGLGLAASTANALDIVTKVSIDSGYDPLTISALTASGVSVEVLGAPGGNAQRVADRLRLPGWFRSAPFLAIGSDEASRETDRLVLVFGPARNVDGTDACRGIAAPNQGPDTIVQAAFCYGPRAISEARLSSPTLSSPEAPGFEAAMRQLLRELLPRRDPNRDNRDRCIFC
ncbi:MAG: hypothetical protein AAFV62_04560 [Pseudomonadota bacterium]